MPGRPGDEMTGQGEQDGGHETLVGQFDGGTEDGVQGEPPEALVESEPPIHRPRHGDAVDVTP